MSAKRFEHFLNLMNRMAEFRRTGAERAADPRVSAAKSTLRSIGRRRSR